MPYSKYTAEIKTSASPLRLCVRSKELKIMLLTHKRRMSKNNRDKAVATIHNVIKGVIHIKINLTQRRRGLAEVFTGTVNQNQGNTPAGIMRGFGKRQLSLRSARAQSQTENKLTHLTASHVTYYAHRRRHHARSGSAPSLSGATATSIHAIF